jgi:hypothetical protein
MRKYKFLNIFFSVTYFKRFQEIWRFFFNFGRIVAIENLKKHLILALCFGYLFEALESLGVESLVFPVAHLSRIGLQIAYFVRDQGEKACLCSKITNLQRRKASSFFFVSTTADFQRGLMSS